MEDKIQEQLIRLSDIFKYNIFSNIDIDKIRDHVPLWISDAGISAESYCSKEQFDIFAKKNKNELTHRLLYYYNCDLMITSLQERFLSMTGIIQEIYQSITPHLKYKISEYDNIQLIAGGSISETVSKLDFVFILLSSCFDILTKLAVELSNIEKIDFSKQVKLKSKDTKFGQRKGVGDRLQQNLFSKESDSNIELIQFLRNRFVHSSSLDNLNKIYIGHKGNETEKWIFFPDLDDYRNIHHSGNRSNFYSQERRIQEFLPDLIQQIEIIIYKTLEQMINLYPCTPHIDVNDLQKYRAELKLWSNCNSDIATPD